MKRCMLLLALTACGSAAADPAPDGGSFVDAADGGQIQFGDGAPPGDGSSCDPPDMLVVLDRSDSMNNPPEADAGASKWSLAVSAVDAITTAPTDTTLRFGLELLPDQTLTKGDAGACGSGTMSIATGLGNGSAIASALSQTQLLYGTPIGGALALAESSLASSKVPSRGQYVILVTDGAETCDSAPPLPVVQSMALAGVNTYVIGFGAGVAERQLNDLACGGRTAKNFSTSCKDDGSGNYVSNVPKTTHLYFDALDGQALSDALSSITTQTCCGCPH